MGSLFDSQNFNILLQFLLKSTEETEQNLNTIPLCLSGINVQRVWDVFRESKESFTDSSDSKEQKQQNDEKLNPDGSWEGGDDKQEEIHAKELQKTIKLALVLVTVCVLYIVYSSFGSPAVTERKKTQEARNEESAYDS